jgi:methylmalonyl-CoA decarboxylase
MPLVLTQFNNNIGTITFNNAKKRNCLSQALINAMLAAFDEFEQIAARVVILRTAKGLSVWSAGHDVAELPEDGHDPLPTTSRWKACCAACRIFRRRLLP